LKNLYVPEEPYTIKSGQRRGRSLEVLMFEDYGFIKRQKSKRDRDVEKAKKLGKSPEKNKYHKHLTWLVRKGSNRTPKMTCPICGKNTVEFFGIRRTRGYALDVSYIRPRNTSCNSGCKQILQAKSLNGPLYRFKWKNVLRVGETKRERRIITDMYRRVFQLSTKRLSKEEAFEFFKE